MRGMVRSLWHTKDSVVREKLIIAYQSCCRRGGDRPEWPVTQLRLPCLFMQFVNMVKEKNNLKTQECWLYLVNIRIYHGNSKRLYSHRNWCYNSASLSIFSHFSWKKLGRERRNVRMVTTFCIYQEFCFKNDVIVNEIINKKNQNYVIVSFRFLDEPWTN